MIWARVVDSWLLNQEYVFLFFLFHPPHILPNWHNCAPCSGGAWRVYCRQLIEARGVHMQIEKIGGRWMQIITLYHRIPFYLNFFLNKIKALSHFPIWISLKNQEMIQLIATTHSTTDQAHRDHPLINS